MIKTCCLCNEPFECRTAHNKYCKNCLPVASRLYHKKAQQQTAKQNNNKRIPYSRMALSFDPDESAAFQKGITFRKDEFIRMLGLKSFTPETIFVDSTTEERYVIKNETDKQTLVCQTN